MLHGQDPHTPPPVPELCSLSPGPQVVIRWVTGAVGGCAENPSKGASPYFFLGQSHIKACFELSSLLLQ